MRSSLSLGREMRILLAIHDQVFISLPTLFLEEREKSPGGFVEKEFLDGDFVSLTMGS